MEFVKQLLRRIKTAFLAGFGRYRLIILRNGAQLEIRKKKEVDQLDDFDVVLDLEILKDMRTKLNKAIREYDKEWKARPKEKSQYKH